MAGSLEDLTVDQLLAHAKSLETPANAFKNLTSNPKTRETILRAMKDLNPNLVLPELDAKDQVREEIKAEREERLKLERQMMERDARDNVRERRASIKSKYSLTDADVEAVEKMMVDDKEVNWTHDAAARVYLASKTSATPTPAQWTAPTSFEMPEKDVWGAGIGNKPKLDKIALTEAFKAAGEIFNKQPGAPRAN